METELKNKVVLITGAAKGIGAAVVERLLEEGTKHVAFVDLDEETGLAFQNKLQSIFGSEKAKFYQCDVTKEDQLFGVYKSVYDEQKYIDLVINNAGIMNDSLAIYKKAIETNFTAVVTSTYKGIELMRKDEGGRGGTIINIASVAALSQTPTVPVYHSTKSAVLQFDLCISFPEYYAVTGVRVMTICFGLTDTSIVSEDNRACYDKWLADSLTNVLDTAISQKVSSAASGFMEVIKKGENGSTWLVANGKPASDITNAVKNAYDILSKTLELLGRVTDCIFFNTNVLIEI